jgi:DNA mismatch repair protein MutS
MNNENSLILGDELCSGTETVSATSIFVTGIYNMYKAKSSFIFATHYHEIVNYDEIKEMETVHLKHMEVIYNKEQNMLIYNRKLKDGSGANVYGLEALKALSFKQEFMDMANDIRLKYHADTKSMLSLKQSRYNADKIVNQCEICGKQGKEIHHLQYQSNANEDGIIKNDDSSFHKNNLANLMTLCEKCHDDIHKKDLKYKKVKTSKGIKALPLSKI